MFMLLPRMAFDGKFVPWRADLRGDRPLGLEAGGSRIIFPLEGGCISVLSSVKMFPMKSKDDCGGMSTLSAAEPVSWKIPRRRVEAIDEGSSSCSQRYGLVSEDI